MSNLVALLDDRREANQDAVVGNDHGAVVVGDECLVAGVDESHRGDVVSRLDQLGLDAELDRRTSRRVAR